MWQARQPAPGPDSLNHCIPTRNAGTSCPQNHHFVASPGYNHTTTSPNTPPLSSCLPYSGVEEPSTLQQPRQPAPCCHNSAQMAAVQGCLHAGCHQSCDTTEPPPSPPSTSCLLTRCTNQSITQHRMMTAGGATPGGRCLQHTHCCTAQRLSMNAKRLLLQLPCHLLCLLQLTACRRPGTAAAAAEAHRC